MMNIFCFKKEIGFSFIELITVISLLGILTMMTLPLYSQYVMRSQRLEAALTLNKLAVALETYQIEHDGYEGFVLPIISNHYYQFSLTSSTSRYLLVATPINGQTKEECGALLLNEQGERGVSGKKQIEDCW